MIISVAMALAGALLGTFFYLYIKDRSEQIIHEVTIESGSQITLGLFFKEPIANSSFITDINAIDTNVPASYRIRIGIWKFNTECVLNIVDTTPPRATAVPQLIYTEWLPDARDCVADITDRASCFVRYTDDNPDVSVGGEYDVDVSVIDMYGNETIVPVPFTVIDDHIPPVISGVEDMFFYTDETILYRQGVTYSDNYDEHPEFWIDTDDVQEGVPGEYTVIYNCRDEYGNLTSVSAVLELEERPEHYDDMLIVYDMAREVLADITTEDMTDLEKAFNIFYWARYNIHYIGTSTKVDWIECALEGFRTYQGDCFTYYSCCKALLDVAGIENMFVQRSPYYYSHHYWNLVLIDGQWYHCDATPSTSHTGFYFMYTDAELDNGHRFDEELDQLPPRAEESVQRNLNYYTRTLREG